MKILRQLIAWFFQLFAPLLLIGVLALVIEALFSKGNSIYYLYAAILFITGVTLLGSYNALLDKCSIFPKQKPASIRPDGAQTIENGAVLLSWTFLAWCFTSSIWGDPWSKPSNLPGFFISITVIWCCSFILFLKHEIGHLLMARAVGFLPLEIQIGTGKTWLTLRQGDLEWRFRLLPSGSHTCFLALSEHGYRWRNWLTIAGGLLMDIATLLLLLLAWHHSPGPFFSDLMLVAVLLQGFMLIPSVIPYQFQQNGETFYSDAHHLWFQWMYPQPPVAEIVAQRWFHLGLTYWNRNDHAKAQRTMEEGLQKYPRHFGLRCIKCDCLFEQQDYAQALPLMQEIALEIPADNPPLKWIVTSRIILLTFLGGDPALSRRIRAEYLDSLPNDAEKINFLDTLATTCIGIPVPEMAGELLEPIIQAQEQAPARITLLGIHAALLVELGREAEAEPMLQKVLAESKAAHDQAICAFYLALIAHRRGDTASRDRLRKLSRSSPAFANFPWLQKRHQTDFAPPPPPATAPLH